jgi:DNA-binding MarR family transcriptional regulator
MKQELPIGYYLRKTDNLLTEGIKAIHKEHDIDRTQWQILHSLYRHGRIGKDVLSAILTAFAYLNQLETACLSWLQRNLVHVEDGMLALSEKGEEHHRACLKKQLIFRTKTIQHISKEKYNIKMITLTQMLDNLA